MEGWLEEGLDLSPVVNPSCAQANRPLCVFFVTKQTCPREILQSIVKFSSQQKQAKIGEPLRSKRD